MDHTDVQDALREIADPKVAESSARFFKTDPGEYSERDQFLGIRVPQVRKIAREFNQLSLKETELLLHSDFHEERLCALIILVNKYQRAEKDEQKEIFDRYLNNTEYINNWDLVDTSAQHIIGSHLSDKKRSLLYKLAKSDNLWERRIAILSTFYFIKNDDFEDTLAIAKILLEDEHDLIHKAVGWMLREIGKRSEHTLKHFLDEHIDYMPRTMLRYAIEKLSESDRQMYLLK